MLRCFISLLCFLIHSIIIGQKDSIDRFNLKKYSIGIELGQSPILTSSLDVIIHSQRKPYYKLNLTYNGKLKGLNNYVVSSIGFATEMLTYTFSTQTTSNFTIDSNSTIINGYFSNKSWQSRDIKIYYASLEFGYQHLYTLFKNKNIKNSTYIGVVIKPQIGSYSKYIIINEQDSIIRNNIYMTKIENDSFKSGPSFYESATKYFLLNFNNGIVINCKKNQHYFGLNISARLNNAESTYFTNTQRFYFRLIYSFYF